MIDDTELQALETRMRPRLASSLVLWLILGFVVIFVLWAALTQLDRTVRGIGRVIPTSQLQTISNLEGGIIDDIMVQVGQIVKAGQPLLRLDQTQSGGEFGSGQATVGALSAKIARLTAEITGRPPAFPTAGTAGQMQQIEIEKSLYNARVEELRQLSNAARARADAARRAVAEASAMLSARQSAAFAAESELAAIRPLVERGIEPRMMLTRAVANAETSRSEATAAASALSRAQANVAEANATLAQQIESWKSRSATDLAAAQGELAARRSMLPTLAERVRRTTVTAPVSGRINRVLVTTRGSAVAPGSPLVELVPSEDGLIIEAKVSPKDIASVRLNQKSKVNVSAYDSSIYGSLEGRVIAISPDAIINENTGENYYLVRIRTAKKAIESPDGKPLPIGTGMTVDVALLGDPRSVLSYFLTPITRLSENAFRE